MPDIVKMTERHLPRAAELEKLCFSLPWSEEMLRSELENPLSRCFAAEENGRLLGYACMQTVLDEGYIGNIAVAPEARRQKIGSALLSALLEYGRANALSFLTLEVRESNLPAVSLYRKFGFAAVGRRKKYYSLPVEDAILMTYTYDKEGKRDADTVS